jgi:GNAT superfamily N-acetyltransferase
MSKQNSKLVPIIRLAIKNDESTANSQFGRGIADLCLGVRTMGSLNAAAKSMKMAYSKAWRIIKDGEKVGGAVVKVDGERGELELLFTSPNAHGRGIGYAAWCEIEKAYPQVKVWGLVTPYFEKRNIHFYVNRCGFHIVEFFNSYHPDPNDPDSSRGEKDDQLQDGMFRFEKRMP